MPPVSVDVPAGLPAVHVDAVRIGHVVVNLVDNARRYGGPGPISIAARRGRGSRVVVTVEDQGPGIPAELKAQFDRMGNPNNCDIVTLGPLDQISEPNFITDKWAVTGLRVHR